MSKTKAGWTPTRLKGLARDLIRLSLAGFLLVIASRFSFADDPIQFNTHVRPILANNCFACHGQDEETRESGLRLDLRKSAIELGAIQPGDPDNSELIARIESTDSDLIMPPTASGHQLTKAEISILRKWIENGAEYQQHWAFIPLTQVVPPQDNSGWSNHPIDRFVRKSLEAANLAPNPAADRLQRIRRLSLDLTGLPPTVAEADAFATDPSPDAYEKVVDRLLESDAFGEHWARMWLDLARYADTKGYEKDRPRTIWRYRDWVIDALNQDMPYDQFTIEQLAGDLLPNPTTDQILATAFHRNTMENDEGGTDDEEFRVAAIKDRVDTTLQVWMGLTAGCAKCHSHKYDPISQREYYELYAFFNQTEDADREQPLMPIPTKHQQQQMVQLESEIKAHLAKLRERPDEFDREWKAWRTQFEERPLWTPLNKSDFESKSNLTLQQDSTGTFNISQELPEKDTWILTLDLPDNQPVTSLRIDTIPKPAGGKWADKNVALRELTAELIQPGQAPTPIKLTRPRADFSQRGWEVAKAIDGKTNAGWAFSPKASDPHCAIFDLEQPIEPSTGAKIRLTLEQEYGIGLLLKEFRISASSYASQWLRPDLKPNLETIFQRQVYAPTKEIYAAIDSTRSELETIRRRVPRTPIMRELASDKQRETQIHIRGNFLDQGEKVEAQVPQSFGVWNNELPTNRLGVAYWLMQPENPLTARVAVNRIWSQLFGIGFVETEEDFGTQGTLPSHPELLDWLASEFQTNGWSHKKLIKTIVMSKTYQQSANTSDAKLSVDPRNRLFARGPRFRLSAEVVRDQALAVSGLLTQKIGGPSVMPPQPDGIWKSTYSGEKWKNATGPDRFRRALYTYKKRTSPYPAMTTFDAGSGEVCQIRRVRTNTPLQALVTLNDQAYIEAAGALAKRMDQSSEQIRDKIGNGFRMVLIRHATEKELDRLVQLYNSLADDLAEGDALLKSAGQESGDARLVALANVLLNLDETLMKP